jgi:pimeloyl-ACP methyl ester carboxylesterase
MSENPIVFVHGLWMTPRSWERFAERYTDAGYEVHAPAWPGLEVEVEALRTDPSPLASLTIAKVVDHYERFIRGLPKPPIIMGHSFGGLFTLLLVDRGLGTAGVGLSPAPPRGVRRLPLSTVRSASRILRNPLNRHRAVKYTLNDFHYTMTNTLTLEDSKPYYERYAVPAAGPILFEGAMAELNPRTAARVDFHRNDRAPLLVVGNGRDHVVPASASKRIAHKYRKSSAVTDYVEYPSRPHFPGVPGWEEVADHALEWAAAHAPRAT